MNNNFTNIRCGSNNIIGNVSNLPFDLPHFSIFPINYRNMGSVFNQPILRHYNSNWGCINEEQNKTKIEISKTNNKKYDNDDNNDDDVEIKRPIPRYMIPINNNIKFNLSNNIGSIFDQSVPKDSKKKIFGSAEKNMGYEKFNDLHDEFIDNCSKEGSESNKALAYNQKSFMGKKRNKNSSDLNVSKIKNDKIGHGFLRSENEELDDLLGDDTSSKNKKNKNDKPIRNIKISEIERFGNFDNEKKLFDTKKKIKCGSRRYSTNYSKERYQESDSTYTYNDFKSRVLDYVVEVTKVGVEKSKKPKEKKVRLFYMLTSILREIKKNPDKVYVAVKSCAYVDFLLSKFDGGNYPLCYYFVKEDAVNIISLFSRAIENLINYNEAYWVKEEQVKLLTNEGVDAKKYINILRDKESRNKLKASYTCAFEALITYYAQLCIESNDGLEITNSGVRKSVFSKLRSFLKREPISHDEYISDAISSLDNFNDKKNEKQNTFGELYDGFINKFDKLHEAIDKNQKIGWNLFSSKPSHEKKFKKFKCTKGIVLNVRNKSVDKNLTGKECHEFDNNGEKLIRRFEDAEKVNDKNILPAQIQNSFFAEEKYIGDVRQDGNSFLYSILCQIPKKKLENKFCELKKFVDKRDKSYKAFVAKLDNDGFSYKFGKNFSTFRRVVQRYRDEDATSSKMVKRTFALRVAIAMKYIESVLGIDLSDEKEIEDGNKIKINNAINSRLLTVLGRDLNGRKGSILADELTAQIVADIFNMDVLIGMRDREGKEVGYIFVAPSSKAKSNKKSSALSYGSSCYKIDTMEGDNKIKDISNLFKEMVKNNNGKKIIILLDGDHYVPLGIDKSGVAYSFSIPSLFELSCDGEIKIKEEADEKIYFQDRDDNTNGKCDKTKNFELKQEKNSIYDKIEKAKRKCDDFKNIKITSVSQGLDKNKKPGDIVI